MEKWLTEQKTAAETRFQSIPMPVGKDENFQFLDLSGMDMGKGSAADGTNLPTEFSSLEEGEAALVAINGAKASAYGKSSAYFTDLLSALEEKPELVKKYLRDPAFYGKDKFAQLSAARWQSGVFLYVGRNMKVELPLRAALWSGVNPTHYRNILVLEEGAEVRFIEEFAGEGESLATNLTEIFVEKNAKLIYSQVQRLPETTPFFLRQLIHIAAGGKVEQTPVFIGGKKGQLRQDVFCQGEGSAIEVVGAAHGDKDRQMDFWMNMEHAIPRTTSGLDFWFVMNDKARAVFNGMIRITKDGQETVAHQKCRSLMLSPKATVHAIPKLEIATDAVKCNHGASVSAINPEQVHYLQSRGIPKNEAEKMIIRGFTETVLSRLPTKALYERVSEVLQ